MITTQLSLSLLLISDSDAIQYYNFLQQYGYIFITLYNMTFIHCSSISNADLEQAVC